MSIRKLFVAFFFLIVASQARSQSLSDGVRLGLEPIGTGARATAMGGAAIANANDYSALDWNPAALTLMNSVEFTLSGYYKGHNSTAQYLGTSADQSVTNFDLGSFGYAVSIPTQRGHLAYGISYDRVQDYNTSYSFSAINNSSSFLNTKGFINDPGFDSRNETYQDYINGPNGLRENNLAWNLYLINSPTDTVNPKLTTPFSKGLLQKGTVTEEGGVNALRIGGAIDVSENLSLGATGNFYFGNYNYRRVFSETNVNNLISVGDSLAPNGFQSAQIVDNLHQSEAGFGIKLGLLATPSDFFHFGFTLETPTVYSVNETFQRTGSATFVRQPPDILGITTTVTNNYTLTTPIKLGAGVSFNVGGLTISGAADFSDMSQLRYSDADFDLSDLNDSVRADMKTVLNWSLGAEYVIKPWGLILRGGFAMNPSPYKGDPSSYNTTKISGGVGILLSKSVIAEITYVRASYQTSHSVYNDTDNTTGNNVSAAVNADAIVQNQVLLSFSFRW